tara:strand:- start:494 stop:817 length:324 start_codon:yes stop_codon:yes gene_type:complete
MKAKGMYSTGITGGVGCGNFPGILIWAVRKGLIEIEPQFIPEVQLSHFPHINEHFRVLFGQGLKNCTGHHGLIFFHGQSHFSLVLVRGTIHQPRKAYGTDQLTWIIE